MRLKVDFVLVKGSNCSDLNHILFFQLEFIRGLMLLVVEKMTSDLPEVLQDDLVFCHVVNETLAFQKELVDSFNFPSAYVTCLRVLTQRDSFRKWLDIERKCEL